MTQLEDFRSHLAAASDAAAREMARARLHAAQAAANGGARPAPAMRRRRRGRFVAAGAAVLAVALAALLIGIGAGRDDGAISGLGPAPADARAVLAGAAQSAAAAHDGGIARMPRPDEYFYLEIRGTYRDTTMTAAGETSKLDTRTYRRWQSVGRTGRIETGIAQPGSGRSLDVPMRPTKRHVIGNERFSDEQLAAFDPTPSALYRRLLDGVSPGQGSSPEAEVFVQLVDALRDVPLPPRLRATFLRALADVPGLVLTGPTTDALGRSGVGIAYVERSREDQRHALVLGTDGALLAVRETTDDGKLLEDAVIVHQSITSTLPPAEAQPSAP